MNTLFFPLLLHVVLPVGAGVLFFLMARKVRGIAPLRTLITGGLTYRGAYWGFLFLGVYLVSRPLQLLAPHPWPLWINNIREFLMMGFFAPAALIGMMSLVWGEGRVPRWAVGSLLSLGGGVAAVFVWMNGIAIGGSQALFSWGSWTAYDGLWLPQGQRALDILFYCRLVDPILLILAGGVTVSWHAQHYPANKRALYDNMPRKLMLLALGCYAFSFSMLLAGALTYWAGIPYQWWIVYGGSLCAGVLETRSLSLPVRRHVQVSEHV